MKLPFPINSFKASLAGGKAQIGLWSSLCHHASVEILAGAGFDWLLLDMEHAPNDICILQTQLQAMAAGTTAPVVRPAWNDPVLIKRILDLGAQNLLVPYVQNAAEARAAVAATRYPPQGIRGVAVTHRANQWGRTQDYFARANENISVTVQIETVEALANLEAIAGVEGVDGLFIGPSDLAASLGHLGQPGQPEVRQTIEETVRRILATGKAPGILTPIEADARHWLGLGCTMVAVGSDVGILARQTEGLAARFRSG